MTFWAHCSHIKSDWSSKSVPRSQKHDMESFKTGSFQWFRMVFGWPGGGRRGGSYQIHSSTGGGHSWCSMVQHGGQITWVFWPQSLCWLRTLSYLRDKQRILELWFRVESLPFSFRLTSLYIFDEDSVFKFGSAAKEKGNQLLGRVHHLQICADLAGEITSWGSSKWRTLRQLQSCIAQAFQNLPREVSKGVTRCWWSLDKKGQELHGRNWKSCHIRSGGA